MITITLDVGEVIDIAYRNLSTENKQQINDAMCVMLRQTINNLRSARIKKMIDEISNDSTSDKLNPEILSELLRDDD